MIAETFSKVKNVWPQGHKIGKKDLKARKTVAGDVKRNNTPLLLFHQNSDICF